MTANTFTSLQGLTKDKYADSKDKKKKEKKDKELFKRIKEWMK